MPYPQDHVGRIAYWTRQIDYAGKRVKPFFEASNRLVKIYNNLPTTEREKTADQVGVPNIQRTKANLVFAWIDQSVANLTSRNPLFSVTAKNSISSSGVLPVSTIVNYWYEETSQLHHDKRCLLDAFLCPYSVKKIGWTADVVGSEDILTPSDLSQHVIDDPEQEDAFMLAGIPTRSTEFQDHPYHIEHHTQTLQDPTISPEFKPLLEAHIDEHVRYDEMGQPDNDTTIQWEAPYGIRWEPDMFRIDPYARDGIRDARWVAFQWIKPIDDVKSNLNYSYTSNLNPSMRPEDAPTVDPTLSSKSSDDYDDFGLIRGWEIWARNFPMARGKRKNMLIVMAEGHDKLLRHDDEWPYTNIEDFPAELMYFQTDVKKWMNNPLLCMAGADNAQTLVNEILDSYLSVVRKQKNIWLYDPRLLDEEKMRDILAADEATTWPVDGLADAQGKAVQALPFLDIPPEKGELLNIIQNMFDRTAGTPQPIRSPRSETATEASIHERRTTAREESKLDEYQEFQVNTARKFWQLHQQFQPERQFLIDPRAGLWSKVPEAVARGEYNFRIDIGSQATAISVERKQLLDLLNLMSGLVQPALAMGLPPPNLPKIVEILLIRGYNIQKPEELWPALKGNVEEILQAMAQPENRMNVLMAMSALSGGKVNAGTFEENGFGGANMPNPRMFSQPAASPASISADANRV